MIPALLLRGTNFVRASTGGIPGLSLGEDNNPSAEENSKSPWLSKWTHPQNHQTMWNIFARAVILHTVGGLARFWLTAMNDTAIFDQNKLRRYAHGNRGKQALITVSNHVSTLDDPCVLATVGDFALGDSFRWGWCAEEICFPEGKTLIHAFFRHGKIIPIRRGAGLEQQGFFEATETVADGHWMHIFPEGKCFQTQDGINPLRWGVGKLVAEAPQTPVIVPFVHRGMERVRSLSPNGTQFGVGHSVRILVGDPIPVDDLIQEHQQLVEHSRASGGSFGLPSRGQLYSAITARTREHMRALDDQLTARIAEELRERRKLLSERRATVGNPLGLLRSYLELHRLEELADMARLPLSEAVLPN